MTSLTKCRRASSGPCCCTDRSRSSRCLRPIGTGGRVRLGQRIHPSINHPYRRECNRQQNCVRENDAPERPFLFTNGGRFVRRIRHDYCKAALTSTARVVGVAAASSSSTGGLPVSSSLAT